MTLTRISGKLIKTNDFSVGVATVTSLSVGSGVTVNDSGINITGVITATSFSGDGSNLSNTGSTLSAASESQRVVLTSQTSGTMTASSTDADLSYNATTDTLSVSNLSANVTGNLTGDVTGNLTGDVNAGIVTASSFYGDASNLTGIPAGLGTALSSNQDSPLNKIYYVDNTLNITANTTISVPESATLSSAGFRLAYTNYTDIHIQDSYDLTISSGSELVMDILSLT